MHTSVKGLNLIKAFENCVLTAYPDPASPLGQACQRLEVPLTHYTDVLSWEQLSPDPITVGWGQTGEHLQLGESIGQATADAMLAQSVLEAEKPLQSLSLNQNQFDALVSLIYNIGTRHFLTSTLYQLLSEEKYDDAAEQFCRWNRAGGRVLAGLTRRRDIERRLFITP